MPRRASVKLLRWAWPGEGCPPRRMVWEWVRWGFGRASREEREEEEEEGVERVGVHGDALWCEVVIFGWEASVKEWFAFRTTGTYGRDKYSLPGGCSCRLQLRRQHIT